MNENGNRYALAALRERRAALDGEIKACDRKLRYLCEAISHIDATLSLFDPNGAPKEITAKRPYKRVKLFASGKFGRLVLDALRRGGRPMTTREIVASIAATSRRSPSTARTTARSSTSRARAMSRRSHSWLSRHRRRRRT
jgi:hypothetical protein